MTVSILQMNKKVLVLYVFTNLDSRYYLGFLIYKSLYKKLNTGSNNKTLISINTSMTVCQLSLCKSIMLQISLFNILVLSEFPIFTINLFTNGLSITEHSDIVNLILFLRKLGGYTPSNTVILLES